MLPSQELLRSIPCPLYGIGLCEKPHCFFRHSKSDIQDARKQLLSCMASDEEEEVKKGEPSSSSTSVSTQSPTKVAEDKSNNKHANEKEKDGKLKEKEKKEKEKDVKVKTTESKEKDKSGKAKEKNFKDREKNGRDKEKDRSSRDPKRSNKNESKSEKEKSNSNSSSSSKQSLKDSSLSSRKRERRRSDDKDKSPPPKKPNLPSKNGKESHSSSSLSSIPASVSAPKVVPKKSESPKSVLPTLIDDFDDDFTAEPASPDNDFAISDFKNRQKLNAGESKALLGISQSLTTFSPTKVSTTKQPSSTKNAASSTNQGPAKAANIVKDGSLSSSATTIAKSHARGTVRKAHTPSVQVKPKEAGPPQIVRDSPVKSAKISYIVRQHCLDEIFKLCQELSDEYKPAFDRAIREEAEVANKTSSLGLYKSKIGARITSLKRDVQLSTEARNDAGNGHNIPELSVKAPAPASKSQYPAIPSRFKSRTSLCDSTKSSNLAIPVSVASTSPIVSSTASGTCKPGSASLGFVSDRPKGSLLTLYPELPRGNALYKKLFDYVLTESVLIDNGFPRPSKDNIPGRVDAKPRYDNRPMIYETGKKTCDRCNKPYQHELDGSQPNENGCEYHPGRFQRKQTNKREWSKFYSCCGGETIEASPCAFHPMHVPRSLPVSQQQGFVSAVKDAADDEVIGNDEWDIIALDCEMVYTTVGNELARATFVRVDGSVLYDSVVKPPTKILDYNTKWSGLTEADVNSTNTTIQDVQAVMLKNVRPNTIMIGHSLESDLVALKFVHDCVIDTSVLFPHRLGPPLKRALRSLASDFLSRIIQESENGHDSSEDALTALDLVLYKLREDSKL